MKLTRRGLFAAIAAAVVGKPAVKGLPLAFVRRWDPVICNCTGCQYARGMLSRRPTYEFYPDVFTGPKIGAPITVRKPNRLLTREEMAADYLEILERNTLVL